MLGINFRHDKETGDCRMTLGFTDLSVPIQRELYSKIQEFNIEMLKGVYNEQEVDGCLVVTIDSTTKTLKPFQEAITKIYFNIENQDN